MQTFEQGLVKVIDHLLASRLDMKLSHFCQWINSMLSIFTKRSLGLRGNTSNMKNIWQAIDDQN